MRVAERTAPTASEVELERGLPMFLGQLGDALLRAKKDDDVDHAEIKESARVHGDALYDKGLTAEQVVHDYGDLC